MRNGKRFLSLLMALFMLPSLFPASALGPDFIRRIHNPLPHIKLLAVSGVGVEDIPAYFSAAFRAFLSRPCCRRVSWCMSPRSPTRAARLSRKRAV